MKIFISGGCKNGKSAFAEKLAFKMRGDEPLYYIATMESTGAEDDRRIAMHRRSRRDLGFITMEIPMDILAVLDTCNVRGSFLLDSTTALLANEMFFGDRVNHSAGDKICRELEELLKKIHNIVIVSDFIYSDADPFDIFTEQYRENLAGIDRTCAAISDVVLEASCGTYIPYKGGKLLAGAFKTLEKQEDFI